MYKIKKRGKCEPPGYGLAQMAPVCSVVILTIRQRKTVQLFHEIFDVEGF